MLAEIFGVDGLIVILVIVVVLFGGAAIPKLARNLGSAKTEFEKGLKTAKNADGTTDAPATPTEIKAPRPISSTGPRPTIGLGCGSFALSPRGRRCRRSLSGRTEFLDFDDETFVKY